MYIIFNISNEYMGDATLHHFKALQEEQAWQGFSLRGESRADNPENTIITPLQNITVLHEMEVRKSSSLSV